MKILLFGRNGQVGWEVARSCAILGELKALTSQDVNLTNRAAVAQVIRDYKPTHIINAAAYTDVEKAEAESDLAFAVNAEAVGVMAEEAKKIGAHFMHYSTDYVFNGDKETPYLESDAVAPLNVYGQSKLQGEKYIAGISSSAIILRLTWVYGARGKNFFQTMLRLGKSKEALQIVADQFGVPTWSRHIADATSQIVADNNFASKGGVYHLTPQGKTTWCEFSQEIFSQWRGLHTQDHGLLVRDVSGIAAKDYPTKAQRPKNSLLNSEKVKATFGVQLPLWRDSVRMVVEDSC